MCVCVVKCVCVEISKRVEEVEASVPQLSERGICTRAQPHPLLHKHKHTHPPTHPHTLCVRWYFLSSSLWIKNSSELSTVNKEFNCDIKINKVQTPSHLTGSSRWLHPHIFNLWEETASSLTLVPPCGKNYSQAPFLWCRSARRPSIGVCLHFYQQRGWYCFHLMALNVCVCVCVIIWSWYNDCRGNYHGGGRTT